MRGKQSKFLKKLTGENRSQLTKRILKQRASLHRMFQVEQRLHERVRRLLREIDKLKGV